MVRGTKDVLPAFRGAQMASEDKMWQERNGMAEHVGGALWLLISLMSLIVHGPCMRLSNLQGPKKEWVDLLTYSCWKNWSWMSSVHSLLTQVLQLATRWTGTKRFMELHTLQVLMVLNQPEADPEVSLDNPAGRSGLAVGWWRTVQNEHCQHNLSREHRHFSCKSMHQTETRSDCDHMVLNFPRPRNYKQPPLGEISCPNQNPTYTFIIGGFSLLEATATYDSQIYRYPFAGFDMVWLRF